MAINNGQDLSSPGTFGLSADQATAELARLNQQYRGARASDMPTNVVDTAVRLEELKADQEFRAKVLRGDAAATQQFRTLTTALANGSEADLALAGVQPDGHIDSGPGASLRDQINAVESMRSSGFDEDVIRQVLSDEPVSRTEKIAAQIRLRNRMNSKEWVAKLLEGDPETVRENRLLSVILSSEVKDD
jgi:hypothetical protein